MEIKCQLDATEVFIADLIAYSTCFRHHYVHLQELEYYTVVAACVEEFKYLGATLTSKNSIQEEIKSRLKVGNACYYSVQNLLSTSLLSKTLKIKIYRTIILPAVLYGCETWSLTLREERRMRVIENSVLRRIFGPKRDEVTEEWRKLHNVELSDLYSLAKIVRVVKSRRMRWAGHVARMGEGRGVHRVLVGKPEGKRPLGRPRCRWRIILRWIFRKWEGVARTGWSWFRIGTSGGNLWVR